MTASRWKIRSLLVVMTVALTLGACDMEQYVRFRAVNQAGDVLTPSEEALSGEFLHDVEQVLRFYRVPFKKGNDGALMIPERVAKDLDTMWNYTTKARDPRWLADHPVPPER